VSLANYVAKVPIFGLRFDGLVEEKSSIKSFFAEVPHADSTQRKFGGSWDDERRAA
jgi:hypothetical protein